MMMDGVSFQVQGRSPDWVYSEASNAHLTNDRSWFTDEFTEIDSHVGNARASIENIGVRGIGTVVLPVQQLAAGQGHTVHGSLRLERVLYVPDYPCNVVGSPIRSLATIQFSSMTPRGSLVYGDGSVAAIFIPGRNFYQIMLRGPPAGPALGRSVLADHPEYGYMAAFTWPEHERERFSPFFAPQGATPSQHPHADATGSQHFMCSPARNADSHRIRKRAAPDEEFGSSPSSPLRSVKRTRGMDEHEFGARRILRAVSHGQA